jgi:plasmid stabilization system protein ParE
MKRRKLDVAESFYSDVDRAAYYISNVLHNRPAALMLVRKTKEALLDIQSNATGYPLVRDEKLAERSYRWRGVYNYVIFYIVDNDDESVKVARFLYKHRDWNHILGE